MVKECQRCKQVEEDTRILWMECMYDMSELDIPFEKVEYEHKHFYTLRVCKPCRAFWMGMIKIWFDMPTPTEPGCGSGIYIKDLGSVREITEEEFHRRQKTA